uniref:gliding motility-associated C-terminal domain-containing protein n=1 Tax=Winogradskyella sp. A3E31 TaxID=3349637 RepID=UPI00398A98E2
LTVPADETVECTNPTDPSATGTATGSDSCGDVTITFSDASAAGCGNTETITRTWTATDACGNATSADQIITVVDTTAPVIDDSNADDIEIECGVTPDGALQDWLDNNAGATATDSCGSVTWSNDYGQDTTVQCEDGPITVTFTATDECGNASTVTATYLIQDTVAPIITIPADVTIECTEDESSANTGVATGSDDCSAVTITESDSVVEQCGNTRTITRTWTVTDACNNSVSGDQIITVVDTTPPTISIVASDQTVECDGSGNVDQLQAWLDTQAGAMASDTCGTIEWTNNFTGLSDGCGMTGSVIVTFTATDECNNSVSTSAKFEIEDNLAPELVIPDSVTVECDEDTSTAALGEGTVTDVCDSNATITFNDVITDGNCAGNYTITRTWTATDACGNSISEDQVITVQDTTAPELTVPASVTAECDEDVSTDALGVATATDNCATDIEIVFNDVITDGDCAGNYTITRTWTATDECNNSVSADQTITVQDTTAPELTVPDSVTIECDQDNSTDALGVATATDNCDANPNVTFNDVVVQGECAGEYTITRTWTATDECGNSVSADQTITVQDTTPPTITLPADVTLECTDNPDPTNTGFAMVTDNCSAGSVDYADTITQGDCAGEYTITRTWTAMDECGNMSTADQTITVQDTTAPELMVPASVTAECSDDLTTDGLGTATATDNCDSNPTVTFEDVTAEGDCPGSYTITRTWTATDECGNSVSADQTITVQDTTAPELTVPADVTAECSDDVSTDALGSATATDNCDDNPNVTFTDVITQGDCAGEYTITRTWTATDVCNNSVSADQTITVQDTTAPELTLPDDVTIECTEDTSVDSLGSASATDNCDDNPQVTFTESIAAGDCVGNYTITRTWTAVDECGNSVSADQTITVQDTTAPTLADGVDFETNISVLCDEIPDAPSLSFVDNCATDLTVTFEENSSQGNGSGDYEIVRTWTVSDGCNQVTFTQVVSVSTANVTVTDGDRCYDDGTIDLFDFLSGNVDPDGTWSVLVGDVTLNGSQFDPTIDMTDTTLTFLYAVPDGPCANDIEVDVFINDDCVVEPVPPCGREFVEISKTVTPNGDLFNEVFEVGGIEDCGYEVQLQIFNRWGAIIYKDDNYLNTWRGEAPSGSVGNSNFVPTGTYYYIINLRNSGFEPFSGPIYVATK